jgi:transposase InsO family protein
VLSWEFSNTMETGFCLAALQAAFRFGQPEIWNSDQGSQFTSADFLAPLKQRGIAISMDGRRRALDNVFIERLWLSLKYELIYPGDFATGLDLFPALEKLFSLLQPPAPTPGTRLPDTGRHVSSQIQKDKIIPMMGALPPNPRDLALLFSRMDAFPFTADGIRRTIEMLDRRIGQRRDATRAPIQVRNGWRPYGRLLIQPARPSKDACFLSKRWGPPQWERPSARYMTSTLLWIPAGRGPDQALAV